MGSGSQKFIEELLMEYVTDVHKKVRQICRSVILAEIGERIRQTLTILQGTTPVKPPTKNIRLAQSLGSTYVKGMYSKGKYRKSFRYAVLSNGEEFDVFAPESVSLRSKYNFKLNSNIFKSSSKIVFTNIAKKKKYNFYYSGLVDLYGWNLPTSPAWEVFAEADSHITKLWKKPIKIDVEVKR